MAVYVAAGGGGGGGASVVNEFLDPTNGPYSAPTPGSGQDAHAAIAQALTDAANSAGGSPGGKVLLKDGKWVSSAGLSVPGTVTLAGVNRYTSRLSPSSDLGYGVPLITMPSGSDAAVEDLAIYGPYWDSYSPNPGEVPCLMNGVSWGGKNIIRRCDIQRFCYGIAQDATFGDHCRIENDVRMSRNYVHIRWVKSGTTGNQTLRDITTEFPCLAAMSLASDAGIGGGTEISSLWIHFPPVAILFEDGTAGELGVSNTVWTNLQVESPSHATMYDERYVLWNGAASGQSYRNNTHIGCSMFNDPATGGISAGRIQFVDLGGATGGSYTLSLNYNASTQTTATITPTSSTPNATDAATIRTRLLALSNMPGTNPNPAGNIMVIPCFNGYRVHFQGAFVGSPVNVMTINSSLTGTGTSPRVADAVPSKAWSILLNGETIGNKWDAIDQLVGAHTSGGVLITNGQHNDFGSAADLIAQQQSQADGWQAIKVDNNASTGSQPNFCSGGLGVYDSKIPCEIAVVRTFGGSGHLIERGDVVAMVQEGGEPDYTGSAEQYGIAGAGTQDVLPWGVALTDAYRTSSAGDCVIIATRGRLPVKTAAGTTIAAGVKVMPDAANPGCVVTWTSGNPVVGVSRSASGASVVTGRTNGRAAIPGVVIELNPSL